MTNLLVGMESTRSRTMTWAKLSVDIRATCHTPPMRSRLVGALVILPCALVLACSSDDPEPDPGVLDGWSPGMVLTSASTADRGWVELRGIIHTHSVYSHDACDDKPRDASGAINEPCFQDVRRGICDTLHDFVMLTDHGDSFADTEYPEALLYRADQGDTLVERNGEPVANRVACPDGHSALLMAGTVKTPEGMTE